MSGLIDNPRDLEDDILTSYPFPIAFEYALLKDMSDRPYDERCEQLRTVMWFASRYLSILTLSSYLRMDVPDLQFSDSVESNAQRETEVRAKRKYIHDLLQTALRDEEQSKIHPHERPRELWKWLKLIFEIVDFWEFINVTPFIPGVMDWASEYKEDAERLSYLYDYYRSLPSHTADNLKRYFEDTHTQTMKFLETIAFVKQYPLVKIDESRPLPVDRSTTGGRFSWIAYHHMGQSIRAERKSYGAYEACPEDNLHVLSVISATERFRPRLLPLTPLTVFTIYPSVKHDKVDIVSEREHIAVLDDSAEKSLRYRLVSLDRNITPTYVSLSEYVDLLNDLLTQSLEPKLAVLPPNAGWQDVRKYVHRQNTENRKRIGAGRYEDEHYLERVSINDELRKFLRSPQRGMLIIGDAGVGKTSLLCHWSAILQEESDAIVLLHDCRDFKASGLKWKDVERRLVRDLGLRFQGEDGTLLQMALEKQLRAMRPASNSAQLVFLFDALNEHPEADKLLEVVANHLVSTEMPSWLKVIVTCRSEPWERLLKYHVPPTSQSFFYKFGEAGEPIMMSHFSDEEARQAYTEKYRLKPEFSTLPIPLQKLFTDPLMLGLAHQVYGESGLPSDLHQNKILREYICTLAPDSAEGVSKERRFLTELLKLMYEKERTEVTLAEAAQNPILQDAYSSQMLLPDNPYIQLVSDLLRDSGTGIAVTFRYERVFEFALAEYILRPEAEAQNWNLQWFVSKVKQSNEYPSLWGAMRSLLVEYLGDLKECEHQTIESFARYDLYEMGQLLTEALVILASRVEYNTKIRDSLNSLVHPTIMKASSRSDALMGEVAISVARRLGWTDVFENGARSPLVTIRIASVQAIYYVWRRNKQEGVALMTRIASLVKDEIAHSSLRLGMNFLKIRLLSLSEDNVSDPWSLLPLTSSLLNLSIMMVSHCLREPETARDLYQVWEPVFETIPRPLEKLIESFVRRAGARLMINAWGEVDARLDPINSEHTRDASRVINVQNLKAFVDLPLDHEYRLKAIHYLGECDPAKGRLLPILDEVVELAKIPDSILHFVVQILFLTRGHQSAEDVLKICRKLCESREPYDVYEGTTKMGVYLYSIDHPPKPHMRFMEEQVLWIWRDSIKLFQLAGDYYLLDQLRYPIMYECSPVGGNRSRGQVEFVRKVRKLPWRDNPVDRDIAIIRALGEAAVFGHVTYNTHVIPILETLQTWFAPTFYQSPDPSGDYFRMTVSEAVAKAMSRIRAIYPGEVERYLSFAPARLRQLVAKQYEESAAAAVFTGGQASLPWLFTIPQFRQTWVDVLTRLAKEVTDLEQGFQLVADETFTFEMLRAILGE